MASAAFKYVPHTAATTFAFSSVCFFFHGVFCTGSLVNENLNPEEVCTGLGICP